MLRGLGNCKKEVMELFTTVNSDITTCSPIRQLCVINGERYDKKTRKLRRKPL